MSEDHKNPPGSQKASEDDMLNIILVLDRLASGEPVAAVQSSVSLSDEQLRHFFSVAANALRDRTKAPEAPTAVEAAPISVADALDLLGDHAMGKGVSSR